LGDHSFGLRTVPLVSTVELSPAAISALAAGMLATAAPVRFPSASSAKISVETLTGTLALERLSTVTFRFTAADSALTSGVVRYVPHCPTCTFPVFVSHTFR